MPATTTPELEHPASDHSSLTEGEIARAAQVQSEANYFADLVSFGWSSIARRIIYAGVAYPIILASGFVVAGSAAALWTGGIKSLIDSTAIVQLFFGAAAFAIIVALIALMWASIVVLCTLPIVHLVIWSLNIRPSWPGLGAFAGGLVAFLAILPATMQIPRAFDSGAGGGAIMMIVLGPALATIVGQFGGSKGGEQAAWRREAKNASRRALIALGWRPVLPRGATSDDERSAAASPAQFQFRIVHLLWVGVWLSLILTVIRLSQIPYDLILPLVFGWLLFQTMTLLAGRQLALWLGPKWSEWRQARST